MGVTGNGNGTTDWASVFDRGVRVFALVIGSGLIAFTLHAVTSIAALEERVAAHESHLHAIDERLDEFDVRLRSAESTDAALLEDARRAK